MELALILIALTNTAGAAADTLAAPGSVVIDVWVDRDEPVYTAGEKLKIFFQVNSDCYVAVYDIESGGRENLLFPQTGEKGMVKAGKVYELPPDNADYDYQVNGPSGTETIVVLAAADHTPELGEDREDPAIAMKSFEIEVEEPEPAMLRIISTPKKCRIYVEDVLTGEEVYVGRTPRTIEMRPGEYIVRIKRTGYATMSRRIVLEPEDRRRVFVTLY